MVLLTYSKHFNSIIQLYYTNTILVTDAKPADRQHMIEQFTVSLTSITYVDYIYNVGAHIPSL